MRKRMVRLQHKIQAPARPHTRRRRSCGARARPCAERQIRMPHAPACNDPCPAKTGQAPPGDDKRTMYNAAAGAASGSSRNNSAIGLAPSVRVHAACQGAVRGLRTARPQRGGGMQSMHGARWRAARCGAASTCEHMQAAARHDAAGGALPPCRAQCGRPSKACRRATRTPAVPELQRPQRPPPPHSHCCCPQAPATHITRARSPDSLTQHRHSPPCQPLQQQQHAAC